MSPEVCRGEMAGTASDIYALGITLFHMLVGHAPFAGRKTTEEIVQDHLRGDRLQPEKLKPDIPKPVADLVRKMTRQDPQARPSAKAVAELIAERLTPEKLGARHKTRSTRGRRKRTAQSSNTTIFLIGGAVVVVLLAFLLMGGDHDEPAPKQPAKPKRPAAEKPKTPVKTPRKLTAVGDKALQRDLNDLMAQAKREEGTGNYSEALILYQRAMLKAPPGTRKGGRNPRPAPGSTRPRYPGPRWSRNRASRGRGRWRARARRPGRSSWSARRSSGRCSRTST